jgi:hypothetical protein
MSCNLVVQVRTNERKQAESALRHNMKLLILQRSSFKSLNLKIFILLFTSQHKLSLNPKIIKIGSLYKIKEKKTIHLLKIKIK